MRCIASTVDGSAVFDRRPDRRHSKNVLYSVLVSFFLLMFTTPLAAQVQILRFDDPQTQSLMTNVCSGCTHTLYTSNAASQAEIAGVTLSAVNSTLEFRSTFDDRSPDPYPYRFISGNLVQVAGTQLHIVLPQPSGRFGFGAALNGTSGNGQMKVELFDVNGASLGVFMMSLQRSTYTNGVTTTNSGSEGIFYISNIGQISSVTITNLGDPNVPSSVNNWVIDNVEYAISASQASARQRRGQITSC